MANWIKLHDETARMAAKIGAMIRVDRHDNVLLIRMSDGLELACEVTYMLIQDHIKKLAKEGK